MMKARYLIALVCISLAACGGNSQEPTASREDTIQKLKKDLDKTFDTGLIYNARIEEDGMHLETEKKGNIVLSLEELKELEQGASMDVKENPSSLRLQVINDAYAITCQWRNCGGWPGQVPGTCPYHC